MFFLPFNDCSSIMTTMSTTLAPVRCISSQAPCNVPPVASKSSMTNTFWPALRLPSWISSTSVPYSSEYSNEWHLPGSLPFLRIGTNGSPRSAAIENPNRNPRASKPTITSIFRSDDRTWSTSRSRMAVHTRPFCRAVNMSLCERNKGKRSMIQFGANWFVAGELS